MFIKDWKIKNSKIRKKIYQSTLNWMMNEPDDLE